MTIKDVADALGVSPSTISRTLTGQGRISPATRQMILDRMKDMGYTPNINAQRLVSGRAYMIALDLGESQHLLADMYFAELTRGVQSALRETGYGLLLNATGDRLRHLVKSQAVDGVMLFGGEPEEIEKIRALAADGTPSVLITHCPIAPEPNLCPVFTDLPYGGCAVADFLVRNGHRRIAFIGSYATDYVLDAFAQRLGDHGIPLPDHLLRMAGPDPEVAEEAMTDLLALPDPPTAVFARTDALAAGALRAAHRAGVNVPFEVSVVGHDDIAFARLTTPALTTVRISGAEMGQMASDAMRMMLDHPGVAMQPRVITPELVIRDTVAPPPPFKL
jgi:DNA-binding LacI/PurR family transcriptional regulator